MSTAHDPASVQTVTFTGERYVILPETEYLRLLGEPAEPQLPAPDADGDYPALESMRVILARKLIRARRALGWSQAELARRARVRVETLNRLEHGKHAPHVATVDKLQKAIDAGERDRAKTQAAGKGKSRK